MPAKESEYRSVTLRDDDVQALNSIAEHEFGTDSVSVRTVVRRLITQYNE